MKKLRRKNGFTLIEMLIVVAIVAILIAVSIPLVGSALDRAREATDAANERAFKAALLTAYLQTQAGMNAPGEIAVEFGKVYCYDAVNGKICATAENVEPYGQAKRKFNEIYNFNHQDQYLWGHVGYVEEIPVDPLDKDNKETITSTHYTVFMGWNSEKTVTLGQIDSGSLVTSWWQMDQMSAG